MDRNQSLGLALATSAVLGLSACGGNDVASPTGGGTSTMGPITPAAVACTAPTLAELGRPAVYSTPCLATGASTSSRYDFQAVDGNSSCCASQIVKVDFGNATCASAGTRVSFATARTVPAATTTTMAAIAADGITPVTGSGRTVTVSNFTADSGEGLTAFAPGIPFVANGDYVLCKTTPPSTTTMRALNTFNGNQGRNASMTPTFVLRASNVGSNAINTTFGFDGGTFVDGF